MTTHSEPAGSGEPVVRYSIDRLAIGRGRLFGWGWGAHPSEPVASVHLRVEGDNWSERITANSGLARPDVEERFGDLVDAATSGFVVTGFIPDRPARMLRLEFTLGDGTTLSYDVTATAETHYEERMRKRRIAWVAASVWRRLKRGDFAGIVSRARSQSYAAPTLDDLGVVRTLLPMLKAHARTCIVFDHNLGGGANHYRNRVIEEKVAAGDAVLLCTYNLPMLEYRLVLHRADDAPLTYRTASFTALEGALEAVPAAELFVNSPVSFDEPLVLAEWLARMRADHPHARLVVTAHDYFAVCPSFVLLNAEGRYCGIPDIAECTRCLEHHEASYVALSPRTGIGPWRALWGRCLLAADEVRCFSESTRTLLTRAYPDLARERLTLVPHRIDFVPRRAPVVDARGPLVIGVAGEISPQKGALIVQDVLKAIERDGIDARIVVLGTLHSVHKSPRLEVTGPYRREDLPALVEAHRINMFLFPSVWPETFSYVVAELIALDVPIVAFDLGAPAERLRGYAKARLARKVSAAAALETIVAFHRELADPMPRTACA